MEYASSVWMGACPTSLSWLDAIQRRAIKIINAPPDALDKIQIQPLAQRRNVGCLTLLHRMYHQEAPSLLNGLLPKPKLVRRETRQSSCQHTATLELPQSSTTAHQRSFLPATVRLWNSLPDRIVTIRDRQKFKCEVNTFLSALCQHPAN